MEFSSLHKKKVLVTGGAGFIGRNFVEALVKTGADIRITLHKQPSPFAAEQVEAVYADLTSAQDCRRACENMDYVIHAAGSVGDAGTIRSNLIPLITENLIMLLRVLEAASTQCEKVLVFSSGTTGYPPYEYPVCEEDMWTAGPAPVYFGYGWMRRYYELFAEYVNKVSPLQIRICRPTAVYGRYDNSGHVIPSLIRRALSGETPVTVWGTGREQRDFLHVRDFVRGCLLLLEKGSGPDPFNIGCGAVETIAAAAGIIVRAAGRLEKDIVFDASKPTTIPIRAVDCSKAQRILGFKPEISLETGIQDTVAWCKKTESARLS